jgi:hypothetical protein
MTMAHEGFKKLMAPGALAMFLNGERYEALDKAAERAYKQGRLDAVRKMHKDRNDRVKLLKDKK